MQTSNRRLSEMFVCYQGLDCYAALATKLFQNRLKAVLGYTFVRKRCL